MITGNSSGILWATAKLLTLFEVVTDTRCVCVASAVEKVTEDECSEACFKTSDIEVVKFYWVDA